MARISLNFDPYEHKLTPSIEIPEEEYAAVYDEVRKRFGGFLAEVFQGLPVEIRLTRDTPREEP